MTEETRYFLVPTSSGLCIQPGSNKTATSPVQGNANQLWFIEHDQKDKIAFRNVQSGDYLRAAGGNKSNAVKQGSRQLWSLETSDTPHAFWIKCEDFPNAYLCNSYGNITPNNTIYMWAKEPHWTQTMLWYFFDYESWLNHRSSKPDMQAFNAMPVQNGDVDAEKKLREADEKQRELEDKLKAAEDRQRDLESKDKDSAARQKQFDAREKELVAKQQELESKEKATSEREKDIEDRERKAADIEAAVPNQNGNDSEEFQQLRGQLSKSQEDLKKKETIQEELKARTAELAKLNQAYEELKRRQGNSNSAAGSPGQGAAQVGLRDKPLGMRTVQERPSTTKGNLPPIKLQSDFTRLPRLRAS